MAFVFFSVVNSDRFESSLLDPFLNDVPVSDFFRANPDKRKSMDDWYQEMGSEGKWARGFLDNMIKEAETATMSLEAMTEKCVMLSMMANCVLEDVPLEF